MSQDGMLVEAKLAVEVVVTTVFWWLTTVQMILGLPNSKDTVTGSGYDAASCGRHEGNSGDEPRARFSRSLGMVVAIAWALPVVVPIILTVNRLLILTFFGFTKTTTVASVGAAGWLARGLTPM